MISIVDVGCRYGVYDLFANTFEKFDYLGIDTDENEILRLKQKYKSKKIRFFSEFLGADNNKVSFNVSQHKGYGTSKKMDADSFWFGWVRKDETDIFEKLDVFSKKSSVFMSENVLNNSIIKLDIEGGELDFLNGLEEKSFETIESFIVEGHFNTPYESDSNLYSIGELLSDKGYWAVSVIVQGSRLNKYYEPKDSVPIDSNVIFIKDKYKPTNFFSESHQLEIMCEVLYALKLDGLLLHLLSTKNAAQLKKLRLFNDIKFMIGHKLNRLIKEPYIEKAEIELLYSKLFDEQFPILSDFNESIFFNP
jgi:FkbM family methyltransferase|tara:strand:+ start:995 stop:1915 length:921 start_codon:yes stop_codon:yes gene_type:complete